ncbi:MAG: DUF3604 domain-containing protein [bacterium]|nr:DUF3604 domain-containing protein [bacterium]
MRGDADVGGEYSPYADEDFPRNVYFGDTHIHSAWSADAGNMGNRRIGPDSVYRFSRGEEIRAHNGMAVRLRRPLDFILLSDHAEYLGVMNMLDREDSVLLETETGRRWLQWRKAGEHMKVFAEFGLSLLNSQDIIQSLEVERTAWSRVVANADRWNDPGRFTAFVGYEWTSTPGGRNLHRNVIFADDGDRALQVIPISSFYDPRPESLWRFMSDYEAKTGGRILAIPHNSNVSGGLMFALEDSAGKPFDAVYAKERARREPLVEVTQYKGDSEAHPLLSPNDEFADYETWDRAALGRAGHEDSFLEAEYARPALKNGLALEGAIGVNPFKFGMIGSTDAHTGMGTAGEDNFWGKATKTEASAQRWSQALFPEAPPAGGAGTQNNPIDALRENTESVQWYEWEMAASGYAAIWARENTREALFEAMQRRETYATTGPRMTVRFFGGFEFEQGDQETPDLARIGYAKGVPMGGDLVGGGGTGKKREKSPSFLVAALRDPEGANLDRVQIVKGWVDDAGQTQERVYDVAVSGGRHIGWGGRARKKVGSTVDIESATYSNSIGAAALTTFWKDPDFDSGVRAFYYVRVIEIPKPRWTAYDQRYFDVEMSAEVPMTTQDRAYTSPIWYTPQP